jgi:hypothetical protein
VHGVHTCAQLTKGQFVRNDLGKVKLENVDKAGIPPMTQSKNSVLTCEILYAVFWQVIIKLMGVFGQAVLGLCKHARHTDGAC